MPHPKTTICCYPLCPGRKKCNRCHAEYMRVYRKNHFVSPEQRRKINIRSYTGVLVKRGQIERKPCQVCGSEDSIIYHNDFTDPRNISWLCNKHHKERRKQNVQKSIQPTGKTNTSDPD